MARIADASDRGERAVVVERLGEVDARVLAALSRRIPNDVPNFWIAMRATGGRRFHSRDGPLRVLVVVDRRA